MKPIIAKILLVGAIAVLLPLICSQPATDADFGSWCVFEICLLGGFALCARLLGKVIDKKEEDAK